MVRKIEKVTEVSGLCQNCDNKLICDFLKDIKIFMRDRRSASIIADANVVIYSCGKYEAMKDINSEGVCLYCK